MHRMCVEQCRGQSVWLSCMQVERDHGEEEGGRMRPASSPTQPITTTIPEEWGGLVQLTGSHEAQSSLIKLTVVIFLVKGTVRPKIERHIFYLLPAVSFIHLFFWRYRTQRCLPAHTYKGTAWLGSWCSKNTFGKLNSDGSLQKSWPSYFMFTLCMNCFLSNRITAQRDVWIYTLSIMNDAS